MNSTPYHGVGLLAFVLLALSSGNAYAAGDVVDKGNSLLECLSTRVGPIIIGLGLIGGAAALALGVPGAVQKIVAVVVGGILITSVSSVIALVTGF